MKESPLSTFKRTPAEENNCHQMLQSLLIKENYQEDLEAALVKKKLIGFSNRFITVSHPNLDWINSARASLNKSLKNWNNFKYPAFYIFNEEEVVAVAKQYFNTIESLVTKERVIEEGANKNFELVTSWMKSFEAYQKDMDNLLDERISLQYNLSLLKKLRLKDASRDIQLTVKRNGVMVEEVITLRKEDKDLGFQIKNFKAQIKDLDGGYLRNGRIKDRLIRQAMLFDMLTILQRELEHGINNSPTPHPETLRELARLNSLIKKSEFKPTTYGVYALTNKVFIRELVALSKLDVAYKKFVEAPYLKMKDIVKAYVENHPKEPKAPKEPGFLKKIYAKISQITFKQAATGTGAVAIAGIGAERFFWLKDNTIEEVTITPDLQNPVDPHEEQMKQTEEVDQQKSEDHSSAIEIEIGKLVE